MAVGERHDLYTWPLAFWQMLQRALVLVHLTAMDQGQLFMILSETPRFPREQEVC